MYSLCSIDGTIEDVSKGMLLSVADRMWLYGDGVFDTLCWHEGKLHLAEHHFARLIESATLLGLHAPSPAQIEEWCGDLVRASGVERCAVRVTIEAQEGGGLIPLSPAHARTVITLRQVPSVEKASEPIAAVLSSLHFQPPRTGVRIKSNDYRHLTMEARRLATNAQIAEVLFADRAGNLVEGGTSNLVAVVDRALITPPLSCGILPGVTRRWLLDAARESGWVVREEVIPSPEQLAAHSGRLYRTNAAMGIQPIRECGEVVFVSDPQTDPLGELREKFWKA